MKRIIALALALALLVSLAACGKSGQGSADNGEGAQTAAIDTFIVGTTAEIVTANRSEYNFDVFSGTLSQLAPVRIDENGEFQPLLCSFSTEDSREWTLTVRDGMTWHDGEPVTAEDIRFTLEYLDEQNDTDTYAGAYASIEVKDEKNIVLTLETANPRMLSSLTTTRILPRHIYEGVANYAEVPNERANIGCGPYRFERFDADAGVVEFSAFAEYPDGKPAAQTVLLRLFDNEDTMYMALKAGEIDMVYKYSGGVDAAVIEDLEASGNLTLTPVSNTANSAVLIFNNSAAPGNNENIRKAIACAIDYEQFRTLFGSSYAVASTAGFVPKGTPGYIDTPVLERDLDAARNYLAQAGCADTDGDGYVEYQGQKLSIPVMLRDDRPVHARYAELLKNNLEEIGIEIVLDVREVASFRELTEQQRAQIAVITGLTPFGMAMRLGMGSEYIWAGNQMGYAQVADEEYGALLEQAGSASSMEEYNAAAAQMQQYYAAHMPAVALFWDAHVQAFNSAYSGFAVDGTFGLLNAETWMHLKKTA